MGPVAPPVFLFVVDTCMIEEEIGYLKSALAQAIELLLDQSLVGFITFGTYVQVIIISHIDTPLLNALVNN